MRPSGRIGAVPPASRLPLRLDPAEDARLVERCRAGDARAWEALVRRYERLVYAVARTYRLPDADLGDVFQEVFAALYRGLPALRDPRALCRWLSSTSDRIARAAARRARAAPTASLDEPGVADRLPADLPSIGSDLETLEEQAMVRIALASLPERCRLLLGALYYEDPPASYAALARRFGVPIGSLGPTRARCFEALRRAYQVLSADAGISASGSPTFQTRERARERRARAAAGPAQPT
ncbi:MAG TPA: sigma-70 family RNA polymerase sigma factor [Candidatus Eisenbacteria bacterium]